MAAKYKFNKNLRKFIARYFGINLLAFQENINYRGSGKPIKNEKLLERLERWGKQIFVNGQLPGALGLSAQAYFYHTENFLGFFQSYKVPLLELVKGAPNQKLAAKPILVSLLNLPNYPLWLFHALKLKWQGSIDNSNRSNSFKRISTIAVELLFAIPMAPLSLARMALSLPLGLLGKGVSFLISRLPNNAEKTHQNKAKTQAAAKPYEKIELEEVTSLKSADKTDELLADKKAHELALRIEAAYEGLKDVTSTYLKDEKKVLSEDIEGTKNAIKAAINAIKSFWDKHKKPFLAGINKCKTTETEIEDMDFTNDCQQLQHKLEKLSLPAEVGQAIVAFFKAILDTVQFGFKGSLVSTMKAKTEHHESTTTNTLFSPHHTHGYVVNTLKEALENLQKEPKSINQRIDREDVSKFIKPQPQA